MSKIKNIKNLLHPGYKVLETEVLPFLQNFQEDVTTHDKAMLTGYQGDFISLFRETGTHLFKIGVKDAAKWTYKNPLESLKATHEGCLAMVKFNEKYLYVKSDGEYSYISKAEVIRMMEATYKKAVKFYNDTFVKMHFEGMANIIEFCMVQYGRTWKSKLIESWDSNYCTPEEKRLKNYFGDKFLRTIKLGTKKEEITNALINKYMEDK